MDKYEFYTRENTELRIEMFPYRGIFEINNVETGVTHLRMTLGKAEEIAENLTAMCRQMRDEC